MVITGSIDTDGNGSADYTGTLLTAEVTQFGWLNGASGASDTFDLRLNTIGGALSYLYTDQDLAVNVLSEPSAEYPTPFDGSFNADWLAQAKGVVGSAYPYRAAADVSCSSRPNALWQADHSRTSAGSSKLAHRNTGNVVSTPTAGISSNIPNTACMAIRFRIGQPTMGPLL